MGTNGVEGKYLEIDTRIGRRSTYVSVENKEVNVQEDCARHRNQTNCLVHLDLKSLLQTHLLYADPRRQLFRSLETSIPGSFAWAHSVDILVYL